MQVLDDFIMFKRQNNKQELGILALTIIQLRQFPKVRIIKAVVLYNSHICCTIPISSGALMQLLKNQIFTMKKALKQTKLL